MKIFHSIESRILVGLLIGGMVVAGCSSTPPASTSANNPNTTSKPVANVHGKDGMSSGMNMTATKTVGFVKDGVYVDKAGKAVCPVLGNEVADVKTAKFAMYNGVKYYFCCPDCPSAFKKDPSKYAYKAPKGTATASKSKTS